MDQLVLSLSSDHPADLEEPSVLRIVVADNNVDHVTSLSLCLQLHASSLATAHGLAADTPLQVATASNGVDALCAVLNEAPRLAILGISLRKLDGYKVAHAIRHCSQFPTRLIAFTGWGGPQYEDRAIEAGFDHYVVKGEPFEELLRCCCAPLVRQASR